MPRPKGSANKNRSELVQLALAGLDVQIQQLQSQIEALMDKRKQISKSSIGGDEVSSTASVASKGRKAAADPAKKKRPVSASTRKKLKEAAKARWARARGEEGAG